MTGWRPPDESPAQVANGDYVAAVTAYDEGTRSAEARVPPFSRVQGAVDERRRLSVRRRRWRRPAIVVPAAAAALLLLIASWNLRGPAVVPLPSSSRTEVVEFVAEVAGSSVAVAAVAGEVGYEADGVWAPLDASAAVAPGISIESGAGGRTTLAEAGVAAVTVGAQTKVKVERWRDGVVSLILERGSVTSRVEPRKTGETFEVRTPVAWVTVVGTEFLVSHEPVAGTLVRCESGVVRVAQLGGGPVETVRAGEELRVQGDGGALSLTVAPSTGVAQPCVGPGPEEPTSIPERLTAATTPKSAAPEEGDVFVRPTLQRRRPRRTPKRRVGPSPVPAGVASVGAPSPPAAPEPSPRAVLEAARRRLADGDAAGAIAELDGYEGQPSQAYFVILADASRAAGDGARALGAYERALAMAPTADGGPLMLSLGDLLVAEGRGEDATRRLAAYLADHPRGRAASAAHARLGRWAEGRGRRDDALGHWRAIVDEYPRSPQVGRALQALGQSLLRRGEFERAAEVFERFVDARGQRVAETALVGLMNARYGAGAVGEVVRLARSYERRFPTGQRRAEVEALLARARTRRERD